VKTILSELAGINDVVEVISSGSTSPGEELDL